MNRTTYNVTEKTWNGPNHPCVYNSDASLGYLILNALKKTPEVITQVTVDTSHEMTCHDMYTRIVEIVEHLRTAGSKQGDIVGIVASNSENVAPLVFACYTLGLPINPLDPMMTENEIVHMYAMTQPKIIFCDASVVAKIKNALENVIEPEIYSLLTKIEGHKFIDEILSQEMEPFEFVYPDLKDVSNSLALILSSSGTSGNSKGIMKTHKQLIEHNYPFWDVIPGKHEILLTFSTIFWGIPLIYQIVGTLYGCKRIITNSRFSPRLAIEICNQHQVTTIFVAPYAVAQLLQLEEFKPFTTLRVFMTGGSLVSKSLCEAIRPWLPVGNFIPYYGSGKGDFLTEAKHSGLGYNLLPNTRFKIIDEDGTQLGHDEIGEICYKHVVMFQGYFNDPKKTAETIVDGWIHSGDIGYFDQDNFLFIVDRVKDLMKFELHHIFPSELEEILNQCDGVISSCVVGVPTKNDGNDLICAFVIKDSKNESLTEEAVEQFVNSRVTDAKKLRGGVRFVDAFPMTPSGKIQTAKVKRMAEEILKASKFSKFLEG